MLDLLLDLYDEETLNDAQRRINDLVVRGIRLSLPERKISSVLGLRVEGACSAELVMAAS